MIKNKLNFVPASSELQPKFYKEYFGDVTAVFRHPGGRNILLRIDADHTEKMDGPFKASSGNLYLEYQGKECRHGISCFPFTTLKAALAAVSKLMENPGYGEKYTDKPVPVSEMHGAMYSNRILAEREAKAWKKICKHFKPRTPFALTEKDRDNLLNWGYAPSDLAQIEECAKKSVYVLDMKESIPLEKVLELLDRDTFLSGISRSAFHWTSTRETLDGTHSVFFESGPDSPFRAGLK